MLTVIAYDVADDRRRHAISTVLADHGRRVNYSVFECDLEVRAFTALWLHLGRLMNPQEDRIVSYRLCQDCGERTATLGMALPDTGAQNGLIIV